MLQNSYQAQQLNPLLKELRIRRSNGILYLNPEIKSLQKKTRVLVWKNGEITYAGLKVPSNLEFAKMLKQKFKRETIDTAISLAMQKITAQTSTRSLLELLIKMRQFTWEQIETLIHNQVVLTLEQVLPLAGQFQFDTTNQFDLCYGEGCRGLEWSKLMSDVTRRQEQWAALTPLIPSMNAVPHLQANALQKITDPAVRQHLGEFVNGRSLVDIAEGLDKDPLSVAQLYLHWVQTGWVGFEGKIAPTKKTVPTILSIDDSPVIQTMIKRALSDRYQVLLASNAADGLSLLNNNNVALLLLDVSMPDVDGLELCRQVRSMSQFCNLPIVMLTARDRFVDKAKGQIAGANQYLIKPFDAENLHQVVEKHVKVGAAV